MNGVPLHKVIAGLNRWLEQGVSRDEEVVFRPPTQRHEPGQLLAGDGVPLEIPLEPRHGDRSSPHIVKPGTSECAECRIRERDFRPGEYYGVPFDGHPTVFFQKLSAGGVMPVKLPE